MTSIIRFIRAIMFAACSIWLLYSPASAEDFYVKLSDDSKIHLSESLTAASRKLFEPGWGVAEFLGPQGEKIRLFPGEHFTSAGGVIFSPPEYWRVSPSGRFAVLVVLRAGLIGNPQDKKVTSRQYCPVLNTSSGCLESIQSGELCAGEWDKTRDIWTVVGENDDSTSIMLGTKFRIKNAAEIWDDFLKIKTPSTHLKLRERLEENLGVTNLIACDPIQDKNRAAYKLIADQLRAEENSVDSIYVTEKLNASKHNVDDKKTSRVLVDKAWMYGDADISRKTSMYLIRDDLVHIISSQGNDWLFVEYRKSDGSELRKWMQTKDLISG